MLARQSERLEELYPFSMPYIQIELAIDIGQSPVVRMEYSRLSVKVMIPGLASSAVHQTTATQQLIN